MHTADMTSGSIRKHLLKFFVPLFLGNMFQQLYSLVDSIIVGKGIGDALATVDAQAGSLLFWNGEYLPAHDIGTGGGTHAPHFRMGRARQLYRDRHVVIPSFSNISAQEQPMQGKVLTRNSPGLLFTENRLRQAPPDC